MGARDQVISKLKNVFALGETIKRSGDNMEEDTLRALAGMLVEEVGEALDLLEGVSEKQ
jgi:hypothetical protein